MTVEKVIELMNKVKIKATPAQSHVKIQYEGEELTIKELVGKLEYYKESQEYLKWAVVEKEKEIALLKKQLADVPPVRHAGMNLSSRMGIWMASNERSTKRTPGQNTKPNIWL